MQTAEDDRHAEGAVGVGDDVGVEGAGGVGRKGHEVEAEGRGLSEGRHVVHLDVFQLHVVRRGAGQRQQGQARQLGDDAAAVDELRQRDAQLDELARLQLDAGDGDQTDFHGRLLKPGLRSAAGTAGSKPLPRPAPPPASPWAEGSPRPGRSPAASPPPRRRPATRQAHQSAPARGLPHGRGKCSAAPAECNRRAPGGTAAAANRCRPPRKSGVGRGPSKAYIPISRPAPMLAAVRVQPHASRGRAAGRPASRRCKRR